MIYKLIKIFLFLSIATFLSQNWAMENSISSNPVGFNNITFNNDEIAQWVTHCLNFILNTKSPKIADLPQSKYDSCKDLYHAFCELIDLRSDNKPFQDIISRIKNIISTDNILNNIDQKLLSKLDNISNSKIVEIEEGDAVDNNSSYGSGKKEESSNNSSNYNFDSYDNKAAFINYNLSQLILSTNSMHIINNFHNKIPNYIDILANQNPNQSLTSFEDTISKLIGDLNEGLRSNDSTKIINSLKSIQNIICSDEKLKEKINEKLLNRINDLILAKQKCLQDSKDKSYDSKKTSSEKNADNNTGASSNLMESVKLEQPLMPLKEYIESSILSIKKSDQFTKLDCSQVEYFSDPKVERQVNLALECIKLGNNIPTRKHNAGWFLDYIWGNDKGNKNNDYVIKSTDVRSYLREISKLGEKENISTKYLKAENTNSNISNDSLNTKNTTSITDNKSNSNEKISQPIDISLVLREILMRNKDFKNYILSEWSTELKDLLVALGDKLYPLDSESEKSALEEAFSNLKKIEEFIASKKVIIENPGVVSLLKQNIQELKDVIQSLEESESEDQKEEAVIQDPVVIPDISNELESLLDSNKINEINPNENDGIKIRLNDIYVNLSKARDAYLKNKEDIEIISNFKKALYRLHCYLKESIKNQEIEVKQEVLNKLDLLSQNINTEYDAIINSKNSIIAASKFIKDILSDNKKIEEDPMWPECIKKLYNSIASLESNSNYNTLNAALKSIENCLVINTIYIDGDATELLKSWHSRLFKEACASSSVSTNLNNNNNNNNLSGKSAVENPMVNKKVNKNGFFAHNPLGKIKVLNVHKKSETNISGNKSNLKIMALLAVAAIAGYKFQDKIIATLKDVKNYPARAKLYLFAQLEKIKSRWAITKSHPKNPSETNSTIDKTDFKESIINSENKIEFKPHA